MAAALALAKTLGVDGWTEAHAKEEAFQHDKRCNRRLVAAVDNVLLPEEMGPEVAEAARLQSHADLARMKDYDARKRRGHIAKTHPTLNAATVYLAGDVDLDTPLSRALRSANASRTNKVLEATVFIAGDLATVDTRITWCAMLG
eukprot:2172529-Alexandrium_andersonii.AAC.1